MVGSLQYLHMRRTHSLLLVLALIAISLFLFKIFLPQPNPETTIQNLPLPSPIPTETIENIPVPTASPSAFYQTVTSQNKSFSLIHSNLWEATTLNVNRSGQEKWSLYGENQQSTASVTFTLEESSRSASPKKLECASSDLCQVVPINTVDYKVEVSSVDESTIIMSYTSLYDPYFLTISGTFKGQTNELVSLLSQWDTITQSFTWKK
jgi:hypothetical protein